MTQSEAPNTSTGTNSPPVKLVRNIAGALVLGALGSGLWELALRDAFFALGNAVLKLIAVVWSGYLDFLHQGIGKLHTDILVVPIFALIVSVAIVGPFALIHRLRRKISDFERRLVEPRQHEPVTDAKIRGDLTRVRRMIKWQLTPVVFAFVTSLVIQIWQVQYTRGAATWSEQSIEILAPTIGPEEVIRLRSQLRAIETANQFLALERKLREHSKAHTVALPKFSSIGGKSGV